MKTSTTFGLWAGVCAAGALLAQTVTATVVVQGEASSTGPTVTVNVFADITTSPLVSFGLRLSYGSRALAVLSAAKNTDVWFFSNGTNRIPYMDPDVSQPGTVLLIGGKLDALNPLQGVSGRHVPLGTVTFTRLLNTPLQFGLTLAQPAPFGNFVATTGIIEDNASGEVVWNGVLTDPADTDLNGLPDDWERLYFGGLGQTTWSDDPDHDGFNNRQEYMADTNPTNGASFLRMTSVSPSPDGLVIQWQGGIQATQFLQRCMDLGTNLWLDLATSAPPTPPVGRFTNAVGGNDSQFYRIRVAR